MPEPLAWDSGIEVAETGGDVNGAERRAAITGN
jgi:hypothetical protein